MASICLLALLSALYPAKAIWPHSNMLLIWGMVIPSPVKSLVTSSMVTLSDNCASVTCGIVTIARHNLSTRHQYNSGVNNNCAMQMRNTLLIQCAITPCSALTVTNNRPLIDDRLIPYWALRIPGCIAASLEYLHNHLAHSSGGSGVWGLGCVYPDQCVWVALSCEWPCLCWHSIGCLPFDQCSCKGNSKFQHSDSVTYVTLCDFCDSV